MAQKPFKLTQLANGMVPTGNCIVIWAGLQRGDYGQPFAAPQWADRNVHCRGNWSGGSVELQGSNIYLPDAELSDDWAPLTDSVGINLDISANSLKEISEVSYWTRPVILGGDPSTLVDVIMMVRGRSAK